MTLTVLFTNFGPYHLARLRALGHRLAERGNRLVALELARTERRYPWTTDREAAPNEPFDWITLFEDEAVESLSGRDCARQTRRALERIAPDAIAVAGYARPECMAAAQWTGKHNARAILMSETQRIDHSRTWWKEAIKARRVRRFDAGLVGGPRHRDYLIDLGMDHERIALGYNAVDNNFFHEGIQQSRDKHAKPIASRYFLAINRLVPEKNLRALVSAFASYRYSGGRRDLVLCGDGPERPALEAEITKRDLVGSVHLPGFLQIEALLPWLAYADAFVHPSLMEPWGLVVNEAAASGLPLLVSERAGCVETLVPDSPSTTGRRFDPHDVDAITDVLGWFEGLSDLEHATMGRRASEVVNEWGPDRFALGMEQALRIAHESPDRSIRPRKRTQQVA